MGTIFQAICNKCHTQFTVSLGGGFTSDVYHCDKCGIDETVQRDIGLKQTACSCGGTFTLEAQPRCPNCFSAEWSNYFDPEKPGLDWD